MNWFRKQNLFVKLLIVVIFAWASGFLLREISDGTLISTVTPDFVEYRRYSAENIPITFEAPRFWTLDTDEPDRIIVGMKQRGIDNAQGIIVTVKEKEAFLENTETLYEKLVQQANDTNAQPLPELPLTAGESGIIVLEVSDEDTDSNNQAHIDTRPFRALHTPIPISYPEQEFTWYFVPWVVYNTDFFVYYYTAMRATAEIDNQIIEVRAGCLGGSLNECEMLLRRTVRSVERR